MSVPTTRIGDSPTTWPDVIQRPAMAWSRSSGRPAVTSCLLPGAHGRTPSISGSVAESRCSSGAGSTQPREPWSRQRLRRSRLRPALHERILSRLEQLSAAHGPKPSTTSRRHQESALPRRLAPEPVRQEASRHLVPVHGDADASQKRDSQCAAQLSAGFRVRMRRRRARAARS